MKGCCCGESALPELACGRTAGTPAHKIKSYDNNSRIQSANIMKPFIL